MMVWTNVAVLVMSFGLTRWMKRWAWEHRMMDVPNQRSSHEAATPRGGGAAIIVSWTIGLCILYFSGRVAGELFAALLCVLPIAAVSFIDDMRSLSARLRMSVQVISAVAALYLLGGVHELDLGLITLGGAWLNVPALLFIVWMTNLFNFIDGIDGYAAGETVFAGLAAYILFGAEAGLILAVAAVGFLCFNWHKASIFMGDVGSASLGFVFAVLMLHDASHASFLGWCVLLSLFWYDATVTLWRRFRKGEHLLAAHKKHAYQRLHQSGLSHDGVVMRGMVLNLVFLCMLLVTDARYYGIVFLITLALLWRAMKYVDRKKAFE